MPVADRCEECHGRISRTNKNALNKTLRALTLGPEHSASIAHAKTLASLIDGYPYEKTLHAEYREVLKRLVEAGKPAEADAFGTLIDLINAEAAAGDSATAAEGVGTSAPPGKP